ncbi:uncharacterized protein LOC124405124 [Diprion similis]|uniref:uncharacterized protein LOC124405124 n=1 Tax=Diprion similis TaxID=362088 RepID=UPI001EF787B8|nr:uncharacterized protein LOC124405124 [Diprion similis]
MLFLILTGFLCFFPTPSAQFQRPRPPASSGHFGLFKSLHYLTHNISVWKLCGAAALSQGVTGPWLAMITMAFASTVTQGEADRLAFWTVILGSSLGVCASRLMDIFQGHLKIAIFGLLVASSAMFLWVLLLEKRVLTFTKGEFYTAVALGVSSSWATPALFLELASEIAYPVSEAIVGGYMIFLVNFVAATFYFSYFVPDMSERWSSYWVFGSLTVASILVLYVKDEYNRTLAMRDIIHVSDDQQVTAMKYRR